MTFSNFQILHSVKPLSGTHVLIIIKVIVSTEGNQGEIPMDGDFQKTSPAEQMDLFEFNNILSSSLLRFIFINPVLSVVWQEVSALARQFIGELLSFCASQMSLCTGSRRRGEEESAEVTHSMGLEKSSSRVWWRAAPCQCLQPGRIA